MRAPVCPTRACARVLRACVPCISPLILETSASPPPCPSGPMSPPPAPCCCAPHLSATSGREEAGAAAHPEARVQPKDQITHDRCGASPGAIDGGGGVAEEGGGVQIAVEGGRGGQRDHPRDMLSLERRGERQDEPSTLPSSWACLTPQPFPKNRCTPASYSSPEPRHPPPPQGHSAVNPPVDPPSRPEPALPLKARRLRVVCTSVCARRRASSP